MKYVMLYVFDVPHVSGRRPEVYECEMSEERADYVRALFARDPKAAFEAMLARNNVQLNGEAPAPKVGEQIEIPKS